MKKKKMRNKLKFSWFWACQKKSPWKEKNKKKKGSVPKRQKRKKLTTNQEVDRRREESEFGRVRQTTWVGGGPGPGGEVQQEDRRVAREGG